MNTIIECGGVIHAGLYSGIPHAFDHRRERIIREASTIFGLLESAQTMNKSFSFAVLSTAKEK